MGSYAWIPLYDVTVKHDFYVSGISNDLEFVVPASVQRLMRGMRQLVKCTESAATVLYQSAATDTPVITISSDLDYYLGLRLRDPAFFMGVTDLNQTVPAKSWEGNSRFCWSNNGSNPELEYRIIDGICPLRFSQSFAVSGSPAAVKVRVKDALGNEVVAQYDSSGVPVAGPYTVSLANGGYAVYLDLSAGGTGFYTLEIRNSTDTTTLGSLELLVHEELANAGCTGVLHVNYAASAAPLSVKHYNMSFARRSSKWTVHVALKDSASFDLDNKDLAVWDDSGDDSSDPAQSTPYDTYTFTGNPTGSVPSTQADPDPANRIGGMDTLVFTSQQSIPFYEGGKTHLQLKWLTEPEAPSAAGKVLVPHIPNPDPTKQSGNESHIYLFI
ncbi:MAG: hypothetical protein JNL57_12865 [Bacteroidetes bacterium]|nr:hypothetical protein [Bacteroidota bacterium]